MTPYSLLADFIGKDLANVVGEYLHGDKQYWDERKEVFCDDLKFDLEYATCQQIRCDTNGKKYMCKRNGIAHGDSFDCMHDFNVLYTDLTRSGDWEYRCSKCFYSEDDESWNKFTHKTQSSRIQDKYWQRPNLRLA